MTVRERVLAMRLLERQERDPKYLKKLGVHITINQVEPTDLEEEKRYV